MIEVKAYQPSDAAAWDGLVADSRNATFQQSRQFLDYHGGRFCEASLMAYRGDKLVAVLPAASMGSDEVVSHPGATHGGIAMSAALYSPSDVRQLWQAALQLWKERGYGVLRYRPVPPPLMAGACGLDVYWLVQLGARVERADLWNVIDVRHPLRLKKRLKNNLSLARKRGVDVREMDAMAYPAFHALLVECLDERHGAEPVHTLGELVELNERLGARQRLFGAFLDERLVAATWVFIYGTQVVHTQYIATSEAGRDAGAPGMLLRDVVEALRAEGAERFSFGASTSAGGTVVNEGLYLFKSGFGLGSCTHLHWRLDLAEV